MNGTISARTLTLALAAALVTVPAHGQEGASAGRSPALTHVHHVAVSFRGTPEQQGLLATAVAEAAIAHQHAALAMRDPTDLDAVQRHTRHVLNALDPGVEENGPGLGYGAVRAADRTAHYIELAPRSVGSTSAIETHSVHIATAARQAAQNGQAAVEVAGEILEAEDAASAEAMLSELVALTEAMVNGVDADGDGRIGWQEGEGGLAQAARHLDLLRQAEGIGG
ncbi:MAG: hypothetical protein OEN56_14310 [Gemmatimonadota bacterium]|nr:hypothetical protein [Gemmatimonadota bacterium]